MLKKPENEGSEAKKRTRTPILCSKCPKMRVSEAKKAQKCRFCAREEGDWHQGKRKLASGRITMAFLQITAHALKMQIPHNLIINFYQRARWAQIEATARANVPQRCLEQGFARAVM